MPKTNRRIVFKSTTIWRFNLKSNDIGTSSFELMLYHINEAINVLNVVICKKNNISRRTINRFVSTRRQAYCGTYVMPSPNRRHMGRELIDNKELWCIKALSLQSPPLHC